jgi:hypothetical protein
MPKMTDDEATFADELEIFRRTAEEASQYLYAYLAIQRCANERNRVLKQMQRNSLFWLTVTSSLQAALVVTLGRVFDQGSTHNLDRLIGFAQQRRSLFSRPYLAARKRGDGADPPWLKSFISEAYEPTAADFRDVRRRVARLRRVYERAYRVLRNRLFAHCEVADAAETNRLFSLTNVEQLKRLVVSLLSLHESLWGLFMDGRRPSFRRLRYSAKPERGIDAWSSVAVVRPHERIVLQAEEVVKRASGLTKS